MSKPVVGVTGHEDPPGEAPWAMQIAFPLEKASPPTVTALCEAAALAVVSLLSAPEAETLWSSSIKRWSDGRIRKVVRRGRPVHFERAEHLPGVTVHHRGAVVRAFVPAPTDQLPADLKRLQVSGTDPVDLGEPTAQAFLTVAVNPALADQMSVGKKMAQCAHGAQLAWMRMDPETRTRFEADPTLQVIHPTQEEWNHLLPEARERTIDAGFTEIAPGSLTVISLY